MVQIAEIAVVEGAWRVAQVGIKSETEARK